MTPERQLHRHVFMSWPRPSETMFTSTVFRAGAVKSEGPGLAGAGGQEGAGEVSRGTGLR